MSQASLEAATDRKVRVWAGVAIVAFTITAVVHVIRTSAVIHAGSIADVFEGGEITMGVVTIVATFRWAVLYERRKLP